MDATVTAIMVRGVLAALLACGALICVVRGSRLIADHFRKNERPTRFGFKLGEHELSFSTGAAGTAVVLTSAVWVMGTIWATPSYRTPDGTEVASIPNGSAVITFSQGSAALSSEQKQEAIKVLRSNLERGDLVALYLAAPDESSMPVSSEGEKLEGERLEEARQLFKEALELSYGSRHTFELKADTVDAGDAFARLTVRDPNKGGA